MLSWKTCGNPNGSSVGSPTVDYTETLCITLLTVTICGNFRYITPFRRDRKNFSVYYTQKRVSPVMVARVPLLIRIYNKNLQLFDTLNSQVKTSFPFKMRKPRSLVRIRGNSDRRVLSPQTNLQIGDQEIFWIGLYSITRSPLVAKSCQTKAQAGHKAEEAYSNPFQELSVPNYSLYQQAVSARYRYPQNHRH